MEATGIEPDSRRVRPLTAVWNLRDSNPPDAAALRPLQRSAYLGVPSCCRGFPTSLRLALSHSPGCTGTNPLPMSVNQNCFSLTPKGLHCSHEDYHVFKRLSTLLCAAACDPGSLALRSPTPGPQRVIDAPPLLGSASTGHQPYNSSAATPSATTSR